MNRPLSTLEEWTETALSIKQYNEQQIWQAILSLARGGTAENTHMDWQWIPFEHPLVTLNERGVHQLELDGSSATPLTIQAIECLGKRFFVIGWPCNCDKSSRDHAPFIVAPPIWRAV